MLKILGQQGWRKYAFGVRIVLFCSLCLWGRSAQSQPASVLHRDCGSVVDACTLSIDTEKLPTFPSFLEERINKQEETKRKLEDEIVLLIKESGDYVYSTLLHRDDPIIVTEVDYRDSTHEALYSIHIETQSAIDAERARAVLETPIRSYLMSAGFKSVCGVDTSAFMSVEIESTIDGLVLHIVSQDAKNVFRLESVGEVAIDGKPCPAGEIIKSVSRQDWSVIIFERPLIALDWEGGGEYCTTSTSVAKVIHGKPPTLEYLSRRIRPLSNY